MMIVQEPVQAAIWHCLNHCDYTDAIFLSERLYAEVNSEDSLFLLATSYYRNGQIDYAYNILKDQCTTSVQCRYLLGHCAFELQKYSEAESAISCTDSNSNNFDDLVTEFGEHAAFVLVLLAKVAVKTERRQRALEAYKRALKLNPFLWSCFQSMCSMGEKPNPNNYFNLGDLDSFHHCHGTAAPLPPALHQSQHGTSHAHPTADAAHILATPTYTTPTTDYNQHPIGGQLCGGDVAMTMITPQQQQQQQQQLLYKSTLATPHQPIQGCTTAAETPLAPMGGLGGNHLLCMSGFSYLQCTRLKFSAEGKGSGGSGSGGQRYRMIDNKGSPVPSFDLIDNTSYTTSPTTTTTTNAAHDFALITPSPTTLQPPPTNTAPPLPTLTDANEQKSFTRKVRALGNFIGRRDAVSAQQVPQVPQVQQVQMQQVQVVQGGGVGKTLFSQSMNNGQSSPVTPVQGQGQGQQQQGGGGNNQGVRRSSRLFSSSYSVKENNKSPNRSNKFATPKSPSRKCKSKVSKCNLNEINSYLDLNTKNGRLLRKEKCSSNETVTSIDNGNNKERGNSITNTSVPAVVSFSNALQVQKHSAEGLMQLMRDLGQAYIHLSQYSCASAIDVLNRLPPKHHHTSWVQCLLALAHFEQADYEACVRYFAAVRSKEPYRIEFMDIYSTALWHLQREVALSALAQDLVQRQRENAITWIVHGNCFSLHKEHDTAIKFLQRAVQVNPQHAYAYTLLGHEYITTEELDKAMSCYRNAIRLDPRHYNAWFGIGTIYSKQERFQLAEMNYTRALSINTSSSVIMCHIAIVQHARKQIEPALATLSRAITLDTANPLCRFQRGSIYFTCGRYNDALQELEHLRELVPQESLVYYLIGNIHKKLGNTDLALQHFSWATDLDPKGASSQIKEAFDPTVAGPGFSDLESPASPSADDESNQQQESIPFGGLNEDSDVSL